MLTYMDASKENNSILLFGSEIQDQIRPKSLKILEEPSLVR